MLIGLLKLQRIYFVGEKIETISPSIDGSRHGNERELRVRCRGGGNLVERWVRGCAAQIGCFFGLSGLPMAPFFI